MIAGRQPLEIRLAFRVEGDWWVAYAAPTDTMEGAQELARIAMMLVHGPEGFDRKQGFMALMRGALEDQIAAITGGTPYWPEPVPAPEHERAPKRGGHA